MGAEPKDNAVTTAAIGLLAYVSADVAHHALGHAAACLTLGGSVVSLSSISVDCSTPGAVFSIASPLANLVIGLLALLAARFANRRPPSPLRIFWILAAGFNLLWFAGQLVFSIATGTDDWAWGMRPFHIGNPERLGMIALGILVYWLVIRAVASDLAPYAWPRARAVRLVLIVWLTAGVTACAMAALDHHAMAALRQALPQSLALPIGLLFVPRRAASMGGGLPTGARADLFCSLDGCRRSCRRGVCPLAWAGHCDCDLRTRVYSK